MAPQTDGNVVPSVEIVLRMRNLWSLCCMIQSRDCAQVLAWVKGRSMNLRANEYNTNRETVV